MKPTLSKCPVCDGELLVVRYTCENCDTTIEGRFQNSTFPGLSAEQLEFVKTFVRCEGKFTRMEEELGISYHTIRNRLHEVIRSMGYEPGKDEMPEAGAEKRQAILNDLESGRISAQEAMRVLRGEEA